MEAPRLDAEAQTTDRKRWQLQRDLLIYLGRTNGASAEMLANVFDLDVSRIKQIVRTMKERYADRAPEQSGPDQRRSPRRFVA